MIELRALGALTLEATDGRVLQSVLVQPKRTALLVYLALCGTFQRRDTVLGLFWPELDSARARNALSQALHYLRRSLGEGVVVSRGDTDVGIDPERLWFDVTALRQALSQGRRAEAVALYKGELMPGFFLSDLPEFEAWLEGQRAALRREVKEALAKLAEQGEAAGDFAAAVSSWRRTAEVDPYDDTSAIRLIRALDASGARAEALSYAELHIERRRRELRLEPDSRLPALVEELRTTPAQALPSFLPAPHAHGESAAIQAARDHGKPRPAPPAARSDDPGSLPPVEPALQRAPEIWSWLRSLAASGRAKAVVLAAAAGFAFFGWLASQTGGVAATTDPSQIVVFPFAYRGSPEFASLGEAMVTMLSSNLNDAGELSVVHPRALTERLQREGGPVSPRRGSQLADDVGAGLFILGDIIEVAGRIRIYATLYENAGDAPVVAEADVEGPIEGVAFFRVVDELSARLLSSRISNRAGGVSLRAALSTTSLTALKSYLSGESDLYGGRYADAIAAFEQSITADSTFAIAYYGLSAAAEGTRDYPRAAAAIERAARLSDRLPQSERMLVDALFARHRGAAEESEALYREVLRADPGNVEAWYRLGELLYRVNPLRGRSVKEAWDPFIRAAALDPDHRGAITHLTLLAAWPHRPEFDSIAARRVELSPADSLLVRSLSASVHRDEAAHAALTGQLRNSDDDLIWDAAIDAAIHAGNLGDAQRLANLLVDSGRRAESQVAGRLLLSYLYAARGQWSAARRELESLSSLDPASAAQHHAVLAALPIMPTSPQELEEIRDRLHALPTVAQHPTNGFLPLFSGNDPLLKGYLLGLVSARLHNFDLALGDAARLESLTTTAADTALARALARALRARVAYERGDPSRALAELRQIRPDYGPAGTVPPPAVHGHQRNLIPELLRVGGQDGAALQWYQSLPWYGPFVENTLLDLVHIAPWHLRQAEVFQALGQSDDARRQFEAFVELWSPADPELQPQVRAARGRAHVLRAIRPVGTSRSGDIREE